MKWQPGGLSILPPDVVHTTKLFVLDTLGMFLGLSGVHMRKVLVALLVLVAISPLIGSQGGELRTDLAQKSDVVKARAPVVKSAEMQKERLEMIQKLKAYGVFQKVDIPGDVPRLWIAPGFYPLKSDQKETFVRVVYDYFFDGNSIGDVVRIYDGKTGKEIGDYSSLGLKLY
jgi:hypothetical protein